MLHVCRHTDVFVCRACGEDVSALLVICICMCFLNLECVELTGHMTHNVTKEEKISAD